VTKNYNIKSNSHFTRHSMAEFSELREASGQCLEMQFETNVEAEHVWIRKTGTVHRIASGQPAAKHCCISGRRALTRWQHFMHEMISWPPSWKYDVEKLAIIKISVVQM